MKKTLLLSLLVAASTAVSVQADTIKLLAYGPNGGGELTILPSWSPALTGYAPSTINHVQLGTFQSFCVESFEHITPNVTYPVLQSDHTVGVAPSPIRLNQGTAYLYEQFAQGKLQLLSLYDGSPLAQAKLQNEIWYLMGGQHALDPFYDAIVNANVTFPQLPYLGNEVVVINVFDTVINGTGRGTHQDVLWMDLDGGTKKVPDGGLTVALLGMGLTGIGALSRRIRK